MEEFIRDGVKSICVHGAKAEPANEIVSPTLNLVLELLKLVHVEGLNARWKLNSTQEWDDVYHHLVENLELVRLSDGKTEC